LNAVFTKYSSIDLNWEAYQQIADVLNISDLLVTRYNALEMDKNEMLVIDSEINCLQGLTKIGEILSKEDSGISFETYLHFSKILGNILVEGTSLSGELKKVGVNSFKNQ
jgi:hypothetical protein